MRAAACGRIAALALLLVAVLSCGADAVVQEGSKREGEPRLTAEQQRIKQKLESIGYAASSTHAPDGRGVTVHRPRAAPGYVLITSGHGPVAILLDKNGEPVHVWSYPFRRIWPDAVGPRFGDNVGHWRNARMLDNGDLLAIFPGAGLIRLDWESNLLWASDIPAHHDLDVLADGDIYVLTRQAHLVPRIDAEWPILEDFVVRLDSGGRIEESFSLLDAFERSDLDPKVEARFRPRLDLFHTNTLEVFDGSQAHLSPLFARGNILTAFNKLSVIAIVDPRRREIVWAKAGNWEGVHHPTLLEDGRILLFANGRRRGASAVIMLDPLRPGHRWRYVGTPPGSFFSKFCGSADALPNGNVLIADSMNGRIFEVTRKGKIVWEYFNHFEMPERSDGIPRIFSATPVPGLPVVPPPSR